MGIFSRKKGDEWLDWLSDEQPSDDVRAELQTKKSLRRQKPVQPAPVVIHPAPSSDDQARRERLRRAGLSAGALPQQKPTKANSTAISININIPQLRDLKRKLPWQTLRYWSTFGVLVVVIAIGLRGSLELVPKITQGGDKKDVQGTSTETRATPSFKPLAPEKKPELSSGNSDNAKYDGKRDLYTFQDTFSGANLLVSQQPMAEVLKNDPAKILQLTDSIGAKEKVVTAHGVVYFGVDEKSKILRAVLINTNQSRLVFLQSDKSFDAETLKFYYETLR